MEEYDYKDDAYKKWASCITTFDTLLNSEMSASVGDSAYYLLDSALWKMKWLMAYYENEVIEEEIGTA